MKIKRIGIFFMIALLLSGWDLRAQEKKQLTLRESIELGVKSSKQLKINFEKIEEATAVLKEAEDKRLPDASVSGAYMRILASKFDLKSNNNNSGGSSNSQPPTVSQAVYGIANVSLPIYTGGRIKFGIESARYLEQAAKLDAENNKDEVIQNTIEAFANLFKAKNAVKLMQENLQQSQQREKDFTNLEKNGLLARNDLLKAQLQTSGVELNLLDAQNNLQLANIYMDMMLGLPTTTELELDTTGIEKKDDNRTLEDYLQAAVTNRKDIEAVDYRKKAAIADVKATEAQLYPNLQVTGGYIAADIPKFLTISNTINLGLGVSYNLGSLWKTKAKVQQAEAKAKEIALTEDMIGDELHRQVNKSYLTLLSSRKKIEVYAKAVEQADENYKIVKNKFDNSLATTTDLLEADVAQFQAKLSYTLARADAFVAYHKLLQTAGILSSELK
ncbi:MAG TPA: TolC family protein [Chitinophagaceae bacterium]|nr:TolC family protein [Chitinophagaceae bacterium]